MTTTLRKTCREVLEHFIGNDDPQQDDVEQTMLRYQAGIRLWEYLPNDRNNNHYMEDKEETEEEVNEYLLHKIKIRGAGGPDDVPFC